MKKLILAALMLSLSIPAFAAAPVDAPKGDAVKAEATMEKKAEVKADKKAAKAEKKAIKAEKKAAKAEKKAEAKAE